MWTIVATIFIALGAIAFGLNSHYSSIGERSAAIKWLVAAIISSSLGILIFAIKLYFKWFKVRYVPRAKQKTPADFIKKFTVRFDKEFHEPHCPVCLTELAPVVHPTSDVHDGSHFKCIPCNHPYRLTNEETGQPLTLREAQALLSQAKPSSESKLVVIAETQPPLAEPPRRLKAADETPPVPKQKLEPDFGVLWDENNNPFCPVCEKRLIPMQITKIGSMRMGDLKCMSCEIPFILKAGDGSHLTFDQAKQTRRDVAELRAIGDRTLEILKRRSESQAPDHKINEVEVAILIYLERPSSSPYEEDIAKFVPWDLPTVQYHLRELVKHGYLTLDTFNERNEPRYSMTRKTRQFLRDNDLEFPRKRRPSHDFDIPT